MVFEALKQLNYALSEANGDRFNDSDKLTIRVIKENKILSESIKVTISKDQFISLIAKHGGDVFFENQEVDPHYLDECIRTCKHDRDIGYVSEGAYSKLKEIFD